MLHEFLTANQADLIIGCDAIVAASKTTLSAMHPERTFVALNNHATPTASFVTDTEWTFPTGQCEQAISAAVGTNHFATFDAEEAATQREAA